MEWMLCYLILYFGRQRWKRHGSGCLQFVDVCQFVLSLVWMEIFFLKPVSKNPQSTSR